MSSIGTTLLNSLRSVERPGDFCVGGIREIFMPTIDVDSVGRIAFPIMAPTRLSLPRTRPATNGAQSSVGKIWSTYRR